MTRLEQLTKGATTRGILPQGSVTAVDVQWHGSEAAELAYRTATDAAGSELLYRSDEARLQLETDGQFWRLDADGHLLRLVSEAQRIRLAYLFDLTILQRRLASSPEAINQSLKWRREQLETRLREMELMARGAQAEMSGIAEDEFEEELRIEISTLVPWMRWSGRCWRGGCPGLAPRGHALPANAPRTPGPDAGSFALQCPRRNTARVALFDRVGQTLDTAARSLGFPVNFVLTLPHKSGQAGSPRRVLA